TTDLEARPFDARHWPYFGSIADYFWSQQNGGAASNPLQHVGLPWTFNSQVDDLGLLAGPYASFLGRQYDPLWARFTGKGTRVAPKCRHAQPKVYEDPYAETTPDGTFVFDGAPRSADDAQRFVSRRSLLAQFDQARAALERSAAVRSYTHQQAEAMSLLMSPHVREAVDVGRESSELREQYGYTVFGQSC